MSSPKISVIIPTFNAEKTIAKALDSILFQAFSNYEILVLDGKSADGTLEIIKSYAEKNECITWLSKKDDGIYDAMNNGIKKAKGDWIIFMGSDDSFFSDDVLLRVNNAIGENKASRMIYGNVHLNKSIGFENESLVYGGEFHTRRILYANICHQSIFYHQSLFQELGVFNTKYKLLADWDFNLRCFNLANPHYLDIIVSNYFVGSTSAQNVDDLFKKDLVQNMVFTYPYSYRHNFFQFRKRGLLNLFFKQLRFLQIGKAWKVFRVFFFQLWPFRFLPFG
ncbi:MAG: glycosyltransferase family 2 protein [Ferruginibacter sp.]